MRIALLCASLVAIGLPAPAQQTSTSSATQGVQSTEGLDMQAARAKMMTARGRTVAYTRAWDISGIPHYVPKLKVTGTIRVWGSNYITDGMLGGFWEDAFKKYQPGANFQWNMKTALAAVPSLVFGVSDLGIGRKITFSELEMFQRYTDRDPIEITTATGSYDVPGWNPGFGIVVDKNNPLDHLTMAQLDGIFGSERSGGWDGTSWRPQWGRGPEANIRTWGQLGLTGEWANKPIHVYGLNLRYHQATEMSDKMLKSSDKWNEHLKIYANYVSSKGSLERGLNEDLAKDPYGIAYIAAPTTSLGRDKTEPNFKILKIGVKDGGPYIPYTIETIHDRTYPLLDEIYMYADKAAGMPMDPKVLEFMRFVVSQEGQAAVMRDGKYLPLTADVAKQQLAKLDALTK
jgi:phosphate transport system substrate-binding protein